MPREARLMLQANVEGLQARLARGGPDGQVHDDVVIVLLPSHLITAFDEPNDTWGETRGAHLNRRSRPQHLDLKVVAIDGKTGLHIEHQLDGSRLLTQQDRGLLAPDQRVAPRRRPIHRSHLHRLSAQHRIAARERPRVSQKQQNLNQSSLRCGEWYKPMDAPASPSFGLWSTLTQLDILQTTGTR